MGVYMTIILRDPTIKVDFELWIIDFQVDFLDEVWKKGFKGNYPLKKEIEFVFV